MQKLTHIIADESNVLDKRFQDIQDLNEKVQHPINIISYTFITECLTSEVWPKVEDFDVRKENVLTMHYKHDARVSDRMWHNSEKLGSPHLGIGKDLVSEEIGRGRKVQSKRK